MKEKFINFLKANSLYEAFIQNLEKDGEFASLDELCEAKEPYRWIIGAFAWFNQDQHWKIWDVLDNEWQKIVASYL